MSFNSCVRSLSAAGDCADAVDFGGVADVVGFGGVDLVLSKVPGELVFGAGGGLGDVFSKAVEKDMSGGGCAEEPDCTAGTAIVGAFTMAVGREGGAGGAGGASGSGAISMSEIES